MWPFSNQNYNNLVGHQSPFIPIQSRSPPYNAHVDFNTPVLKQPVPYPPFQSDFIGASYEELHKLTASIAEQRSVIEKNWIAILDERSAQDRTVVLQRYVAPNEWGEEDEMPAEGNKWYTWRVYVEDVNQVQGDLDVAPQPEFWPPYFNRPDLVGGDGVLDTREVCMVHTGMYPEELKKPQRSFGPTVEA